MTRRKALNEANRALEAAKVVFEASDGCPADHAVFWAALDAVEDAEIALYYPNAA